MGKLGRTLKAVEEASNQLAGAMKNVQIRFNPFHSHARSAKAFLKYVSSASMRLSNPQLEVKVDILESQDPPEIRIDYVDGTSQTVDPVGADVKYLTDLVLRKSRLLSQDNPSPFL
eukprot:CAMPEP_0184742160 /NCGR_PEP_ID=MMETSP0315-20130426/5182_1 /TAXON_ID=101924 /ORGANISM="Rhodosorus marinus, Strain UTEX LB 2760" /LENGTH=115 /DNA_ID=CAMNT_0027212893 /DNA_START=81 /DNA_END=428 /DNA_ORIENTATION=+